MLLPENRWGQARRCMCWSPFAHFECGRIPGNESFKKAKGRCRIRACAHRCGLRPFHQCFDSEKESDSFQMEVFNSQMAHVSSCRREERGRRSFGSYETHVLWDTEKFTHRCKMIRTFDGCQGKVRSKKTGQLHSLRIQDQPCIVASIYENKSVIRVAQISRWK